MKILRITVLLLIIMQSQSSWNYFDSTLIFQSRQSIPDQFISSCMNQFPNEYYKAENDTLKQIKQDVFKTFKTDLSNFILKIILAANGNNNQQVQSLKQSLIHQFKQHLIWLLPGLVVFVGILVYWAYCIFKKKLMKKHNYKQMQNSYLSKISITFIIISILGAVYMIYGLNQANYNQLASTISCKIGSLNVHQPITDIKQYIKNYKAYQSTFQQLLLNKQNLINIEETANYGKKLLKAVESIQNSDQKLIGQLKKVVRLLQNSKQAIHSFNYESQYFGRSLQLISSRLNNFRVYHHFIIKNFDKQISIAKLPSTISFYCKIFYLFVIAAFIYIAIVGIIIYFKIKTISKIHSSLIPYLLSLIFIISISITIISAIITPTFVLWNKNLQTVRHKNDSSDNLSILKAYNSNNNYDVLEFIKIMFYKNYNVQNIANGSLNRAILSFNKLLQELQKIDDDSYFIKIFKIAESKIDPINLAKFANLDYVRRLQFELQYTKQLNKNFKKINSSINSIIQEQFLIKPDIKIRQSKIINFKMLESMQIALIIESQRSYNLFKKICIIALIALICQIIIHNNTQNEDQIIQITQNRHKKQQQQNYTQNESIQLSKLQGSDQMTNKSL